MWFREKAARPQRARGEFSAFSAPVRRLAGMEAPGYAPERYDVMRFGSGAPAPFMTFDGANPVRR